LKTLSSIITHSQSKLKLSIFLPYFSIKPFVISSILLSRFSNFSSNLFIALSRFALIFASKFSKFQVSPISSHILQKLSHISSHIVHISLPNASISSPKEFPHSSISSPNSPEVKSSISHISIFSNCFIISPFSPILSSLSQIICNLSFAAPI
jgi:hypothetical protein